jgi:hypothetical protein
MGELSCRHHEALPECFCTEDDRQRHHQYSAPMADFTMGIRPGHTFWGLDDGSPVLVDPFKTNHFFTAVKYLADRDTTTDSQGRSHAGRECTSHYLPNSGVSTQLKVAQEAQRSPKQWISDATEADTTNSPLTQIKQISTNTVRYAMLTTPRNTSFWNVNTPKLRRDVT